MNFDTSNNEQKMNKAERMASVALTLTDQLFESVRMVPEAYINDSIRQLSDLQAIVFELHDSLESLKTIPEEESSNNLELIKKLETEKYLKNMMNSFILEKGLGDELYNDWRYTYAGKNTKEFSKTSLFQQYVDALAKDRSAIQLNNLIYKLEKAGEDEKAKEVSKILEGLGAEVKA